MRCASVLMAAPAGCAAAHTGAFLARCTGPLPPSHRHPACAPRGCRPPNHPTPQRFFERWEFKAPHLLCASDCEPMQMQDLLALADADARARWVPRQAPACPPPAAPAA